MSDDQLLSVGVAIVLAALVVLLLSLRRRRDAHGERELKHAIAQGQHIPPSLHPVIDPNLCIGSFSCIKACPEGDIIGVVDGVAQLIEAAHCIGHSRCAIDCPMGAIKLVFGTAEKGVDLPETDESFESSRPGVYVVGELGGMGLIKNALRQGLEAGIALKKKLKDARGRPTDVDVVIVGAGPAGIAAAVQCKHSGLSARIFEQETVGGTVAQYPRGKVVMSEQVLLPFYGMFGGALLSKEQLVEQIQKLLAKSGVQVEEGHKVVKVEGQAPSLSVTTSRGTVVTTRAVVLATGLRGSPRKLGVPGEDSRKVTYRLIDPEQYHRKRVLVVGGGDSAVEAAIQLAEESTAKVSISYRQDSFSRCKARNRELIGKLIAEGRIRPLLSTEVTKIDDKLVHLKTKDGPGELKNDHVIVSVGGEVPTDFLKSVGVGIRKYRGEEKGAQAQPGKLTKAQVESRTRRRLALSLALVGVVILCGLWLVGAEYYWLPAVEREESALHQWLKPAGLWGHGVGVIATVFMLANFLYALRKRWKRLKGKASITTWLTMHMFVGIMSPLVIAFHAAFLVNNLLAIWTWAALAVVVGTGVFGRFLFGLVPAQAGRMLELSDVREELATLQRQLEPRLADLSNPEPVRRLFEHANAAPQRSGFVAALLDEPVVRSRLERQLRHARSMLPDPASFDRLRGGLLALQRHHLQVAFYASLKRLFRSWLVLHVVLALFMVVLIGAHVSVTVWLGYRWLFGVGG